MQVSFPLPRSVPYYHSLISLELTTFLHDFMSLIAVVDTILQPLVFRICVKLLSFGCRSRFQCKREMQCVHHLQRCDGSRDCWDGSDEAQCGNTTSTCGEPFKHACHDSSLCLEPEQVCDGNRDCPLADDETVPRSGISVMLALGVDCNWMSFCCRCLTTALSTCACQAGTLAVISLPP